MKHRLWNFIGLFYSRIMNRMKCGDGDSSITNWNTIEPINCYNGYSTTEQPILSPLLAHTFWHGEISDKQLFSIKSFLCTQDMNLFELIIWLDGEEWYQKAVINPNLQELIRLSNNKIHLKEWNIKQEIKDTPFEKISWYFNWDRLLPAVADDFRITCLYKYGGLYFDLDIMFVKDFSPLLMREEFVYAWEKQPFANSALLFLRKDSYLTKQLAKIMIRKKSSQPWALFQYKIKSLSPLMVYPCCMFDPLWTGYQEGMPIREFEDFFREFSPVFRKSEQINSYKDFFPGIYAYHWHNAWKVDTYKKSYYGMFNDEFDRLLKTCQSQ